MEKKSYITPVLKVVKLRIADGIMYTGSGGGNSLLGNGGSTTGDVTADTKEDRSTPSYNVWNDDWSK